MEKRQQVDAVYIDFAKAFDRVPHKLTIAKLTALGLPDWVTRWLNSYLVNRSAYVKIAGSLSTCYEIPSGVPQGSHLGPLIFVLFINDLCSRLQSCKLLYADDLKIFRRIGDSDDVRALQNDINTLLRWCTQNGMEVNEKKCKLISFYRIRRPILAEYNMDQSALERVQSIVDLGVTIDCKMEFNQHVSISVAKSYAMLGFLRRNAAGFTDVRVLKTLYFSLVRSVLEYAVPVWAPYYAVHQQKIESIQRRFNRPFASGSRQAPDPYDQFLEREGYYRKHVARDGTCLFRSFSEQVFDVQLYHGKVRKDCIRWMRINSDEYKKRMTGDFDDYLTEMSKSRTYGSFVELHALAHAYRSDERECAHPCDRGDPVPLAGSSTGSTNHSKEKTTRHTPDPVEHQNRRSATGAVVTAYPEPVDNLSRSGVTGRGTEKDTLPIPLGPVCGSRQKQQSSSLRNRNKPTTSNIPVMTEAYVPTRAIAEILFPWQDLRPAAPTIARKKQLDTLRRILTQWNTRIVGAPPVRSSQHTRNRWTISVDLV
ncbi:hypothetical protein quinque_010048 [Culex quinquefasciatus]